MFTFEYFDNHSSQNAYSSSPFLSDNQYTDQQNNHMTLHYQTVHDSDLGPTWCGLPADLLQPVHAIVQVLDLIPLAHDQVASYGLASEQQTSQQGQSRGLQCFLVGAPVKEIQIVVMYNNTLSLKVSDQKCIKKNTNLV